MSKKQLNQKLLFISPVCYLKLKYLFEFYVFNVKNLVATMLLIVSAINPVNVDCEEESTGIEAFDLEIEDWSNRPLLVEQTIKDIEEDFIRLSKKLVQNNDKSLPEDVGDEKVKKKEKKINEGDGEKEVEDGDLIVLTEEEKVELRILDDLCVRNFRGDWVKCLMQTTFKGQEYKDVKDQLLIDYELITKKIKILKKADRELSKKITDKKLKKLTALKKIIDEQYEGNIKDYVEATIPTSIDILDKKHFYLLYVFQPHIDRIRRDEYKLMAKIQEEYRDKGLMVVGFVPEVGGRPAMSRKQRHRANVNGLKMRLSKMGEDMPRCLVGVDESLDLLEEEPTVLSKYLRLSMRVTPVGYKVQSIPQVFMINRQSRVIWTGEVKDVHYHLDAALKGDYGWNDYLKSHVARTNINTFIQGSSQVGVSRESIANKIIDAGKDDPVLLIDFARTLLSRPITMDRNVDMALNCCRRAFEITQKNNPQYADPQITVALAQAYFENGELEEALKYAKLAKKNNFKEVISYDEGRRPYYFLDQWLHSWNIIKNEMGADKFREIKKSEKVFSKEFWPLAMSQKRHSDKDESLLKQLSIKVYRGIQFNLPLMIDLLIDISFNSNRALKRPGVKSLCQKMMNGIKNDLLSEAKSAEDLMPRHQDHLAAIAYYEYRYGGNMQLAADNLNKAIELNPTSKNALQKYRVMLRRTVMSELRGGK